MFFRVTQLFGRRHRCLAAPVAGKASEPLTAPQKRSSFVRVEPLEGRILFSSAHWTVAATIDPPYPSVPLPAGVLGTFNVVGSQVQTAPGPPGYMQIVAPDNTTAGPFLSVTLPDAAFKTDGTYPLPDLLPGNPSNWTFYSYVNSAVKSGETVFYQPYQEDGSATIATKSDGTREITFTFSDTESESINGNIVVIPPVSPSDSPTYPVVHATVSGTIELAAACKVPMLMAAPVPDKAPQPLLEYLVPQLANDVVKFQQLVVSHGGTFVVTSTYRSVEYQQHLRNIRDTFVALDRIKGVTAYVANINGKSRPQLKVDPNLADADCLDEIQSSVDQVNQEIVKHLLLPGPAHLRYAPLVNKPTASKHTLVDSAGQPASQAVDIQTSLSSNRHLLLTLAKEAGLYRGSGVAEQDGVHFELSHRSVG